MSGGHDKAGGKAIGESKKFRSGVDMSAVDLSRLYGGACIASGWAPALQTAHPAPCDTLAQECTHVLGCLQLGCTGCRQSSRQVLVDRDYQEKLETLPALGMNKPRVARQPGTASRPSRVVTGNQGPQAWLAEQSFPGRLYCLGRR